MKTKKSKALSTQLHECINILKEYGVGCYHSSIEGDTLKNNNVKIVLKEDKSEPTYLGRGKNKRRMGITTIMPNKEYTTSTISRLYNERMNKIYFNLSKGISNNIMCKILDIEYTEDEDIIYKAFCNEYGDLWLCTENRTKELKEKLITRVKLLAELEENKSPKSCDN